MILKQKKSHEFKRFLKFMRFYKKYSLPYVLILNVLGAKR